MHSLVFEGITFHLCGRYSGSLTVTGDPALPSRSSTVLYRKAGPGSEHGRPAHAEMGGGSLSRSAFWSAWAHSIVSQLCSVGCLGKAATLTFQLIGSLSSNAGCGHLLLLPSPPKKQQLSLSLSLSLSRSPSCFFLSLSLRHSLPLSVSRNYSLSHDR